jgi:hypothetical protein
VLDYRTWQISFYSDAFRRDCFVNHSGVTYAQQNCTDDGSGPYGSLQAALQRIKEYIANGQAVAFSGYVLCGYGTNLPMQDGVIYETSYIIGANGQPAGHGQLVVGYDDNVGTPGDQGALLIRNSFGTGWPASAGATSSLAPPGMAYWSYNSFEQTQHLAAVAYPRARPARRYETLRQPARAARLNHRRISLGARRPTPESLSNPDPFLPGACITLACFANRVDRPLLRPGVTARTSAQATLICSGPTATLSSPGRGLFLFKART